MRPGRARDPDEAPRQDLAERMSSHRRNEALTTVAVLLLAAAWSLQAQAAGAPKAAVAPATPPVGAAPAAPTTEHVRIVLLPMVVHSAENPDYLRSGLSDMLASRLERIPEIDVVRIDDPDKATTRLEKALEQAKKAQAGFVLFGSFTRFGEGASLDVQCAGTAAGGGDDPLREIFVHSGSIADVIPDLDDLVGKVARFMIHDYKDKAVAQATPGTYPSSRTLRDLEHRVEALEQALKGLSDKVGEGAPPAAVSGARGRPLSDRDRDRD